jgi:flagellar biosynthesis regulator FlbT
MTLTMTYSTTQAIKDQLEFITRKRFITASSLIRELITAEAERLRAQEQLNSDKAAQPPSA